MARWCGIGVLILAGLYSCGEAPVFEQNQSFSGAVWAREDVRTFEVRVDYAPLTAPVYFTLRNNGSYDFGNLWLFVAVRTPSGTEFRDTVNLTLATATGRWKGKKIAGLYQTRLLWNESFVFPDTGMYTFRLEQGMREQLLGGIQDVGVSIPRQQRE